MRDVKYLSLQAASGRAILNLREADRRFRHIGTSFVNVENGFFLKKVGKNNDMTQNVQWGVVD